MCTLTECWATYKLDRLSATCGCCMDLYVQSLIY